MRALTERQKAALVFMVGQPNWTTYGYILTSRGIGDTGTLNQLYARALVRPVGDTLTFEPARGWKLTPAGHEMAKKLMEDAQ